jgi:hypothetical protein
MAFLLPVRLVIWYAQHIPVMSETMSGPLWPPYLTLMTEDAPQRDHSLREVFNGLRWLVRAGAA